MKVKALVSFSGQFSMGKGEIAECPNKDVLQDLLDAGYIEMVNTGKQTEEKAPEEPNEEVEKPIKKRVKKS